MNPGQILLERREKKKNTAPQSSQNNPDSLISLF